MAKLLPYFAFISAIIFTPIRGCSLIVEKGHSGEFQCTFPSTATSVTWQLLTATGSINLSTCSITDDTCSDRMSSVYTGFISNTGAYKSMVLLIISARINETQFTCFADNGIPAPTCQAEVFATPDKPVCTQTVTNTYVDYTCITRNVYPGFNAAIHRREKDFTRADLDLNYTQCAVGAYGTGSEGDFAGSCTFRIPMAYMNVNNTVYVEMVASVSNLSLVNDPPSLSDDIFTQLSVPVVGVYRNNCPIGPGVRNQSILVGTVATCKCEMQSYGFPPGFARWLNVNREIVGVEDPVDKSSTLTFSYNPSDPTPAYECWPWTPLLSETVTIKTYTPTFICSYTSVEKGQSTFIQCPVPSTASSITWKLLSGSSAITISTCSFSPLTCTDFEPVSYKGVVSITADNKMAGLTVISATVNEAQFFFVPDVGSPSSVNELEIYSWPQKPSCSQVITTAYVEYTCVSSNVYPHILATLHRRETDFISADFDSIYTKCTLGVYGSGTEGDYSVSCTWRVPMQSMIPQSYIYVEMSANLATPINRSAVFSDDINTALTVPEIIVYNVNCPVGPGVQGNTIKIGTTATCKCELSAAGFPPGFARWFTHDMRIVGIENTADKSSTLYMTYNASDPNASYQCWPATPLKSSLNITIYTPVFVP